MGIRNYTAPIEEQLAACRAHVQRALARIVVLRGERDDARFTLATVEARGFRGRCFRTPAVERWRGLLQDCFDHYCNLTLNRDATDYECDFGMGLIYHESRGNHLVRSHLEWIGPEPPGYDPADETTRATGLCQHVPAFWEERSAKAGLAGWPILDPYAQLMVMAWLIYNKPSKAPNWRHWPDAPNGKPGSATIVREELASYYQDMMK